MGNIFIQKSSATISTFTNELGNGLTLDQFVNAIENINLSDAQAIQKASGSCRGKCEGTTIVFSTKIALKDENCDNGVGNCGKFTTIELDNISLRL